MKRVTLVMLRSRHERSLALLQDLGVLHLVSEREPGGAELERARAQLQTLREAADVLRRWGTPEAGERSGDADTAATEAAAARAVELAERRRELEERRDELRRELARLAPLGDFDLAALRALEGHGVAVRLLRAPARWQPELQPDVVVRELARDGRERTLALVGPVEAVAATPLGGGASGTAEPVALPDADPATLRARLADVEAAMTRIEASLGELSARRGAIEAALPAEEDRLSFELARASMATTGPLALVRGFCPGPRLPHLQRAAEQEGWGLLVEEADPSEAPTEITMPRWVRPIQALFSFTGVLPGYDQVDVGVPFLLFMSLFFAMIVGDAGYGLIFLALTEFGRWRLRDAPPTMFAFLRIMSVCTIVWGVLTGSYFGIGLLPHPLQAVQVQWLSDPNHMILLSFLIGAVHLTVAHGWNVVRFFPSPRALAQLGWIFTTWTMFFLARAMVLGASFPHLMMYVLAAGILLIIAFMTPPRLLKSEWFNHVMLPLSLVSNFVDLVSYVRLFAVGAATFAIAQAFNQMAVGGGAGIVAGLVAALVLFFGHTLNILLATMGVLVHGVRLNMLEFASHLGMEWTGRPYRPFAHSPRHKEGA